MLAIKCWRFHNKLNKKFKRQYSNYSLSLATELREINWGLRIKVRFVFSGFLIRSNKVSTANLPNSILGWCTVVNGGQGIEQDRYYHSQ